jgi:hypothetical protein
MKVYYYINGVDFATFGVKVSASTGLLSSLKMKDPQKVTWPDHHGDVIDLTAPRYEAREITLDCFIKASNSTSFITAIQTFLAAWQKSGLQRLMIDVNDGDVTRKPLVYEIYLQDEFEVQKKWNPTFMIGTFSIKLREPEPVKRVYKFVAATGTMTVSFAVTTTEPVNLYFGDGNHSFDVVTGSGTISHTYATAGIYYIIITGVIEDISAVTTAATLIWNKL